MEELTLEEIELIEREIKISDELQKRNGNRMYSEKEVLDMIDRLGREKKIYQDTQENNLYDIIYNLFFFSKLKESEDDLKNGRVYTLEEVKAEMEAEYANCLNSKSKKR